MVHFGLLTLLVILCSLNQAAGEVYYISPDLCTVQPCLTLSQFAANLSYYLHSNTTLVFLPGTHYLRKVNLTLSNVEDFMMKSGSSTAQIKCTNDSSMYFSQSQCIHITNLEFIGCGGNQVRHVEEFLVNNTKFEGQHNSGTALELIETAAKIVNSTFVSNRKGSYRKFAVIDPWSGHTIDVFIGGAIIATNSTNITISQSRFEDNGAECGGAIFADNSIINVTGSVLFINNTAIGYGGVLYSNGSVITTINTSTFNNTIAGYDGGVLWSFNDVVTIAASEFHNNIARGGDGSVLASLNSTLIIEASQFDSNNASRYGGVLNFFICNNITINASTFNDNLGDKGGGVLWSYYSTVTIETSQFHDNIARTGDGGVLESIHSFIIIEASEFDCNSAIHGGVLFSQYDNITIEGSEFDSNSAVYYGGVLYPEILSTITVGDCNFTNNRSPVGAVVYATEYNTIHYHNYLLIDNNSADDYAVIYLSGSEFRGYNSGSISFSNNFGSIIADINSNMTFSGYAEFVNNQPSRPNTSDFPEGGAITLEQSNIYFDGE